jgi:hypothetical protein
LTLEFDTLRSRLGSSERNVLDRFLAEEKTHIAKAVKNETTIDSQHIDIVNHCAYAFTESGPAKQSGFHFIRVEPLFSHLEAPRFDLALYNPEEKTSILVECKSGISNPKDTLEQIDSAEIFADAKKTELEEEIGSSLTRLEYVLCAPAHEVDGVLNILRKNKLPLIVWSLDKFRNTLKLHRKSDDTSAEIRRIGLHQNEVLRRMLFDTVESTGRVIHFLPSSHMCRLLQEVIMKMQSDVFGRQASSDRVFTLSDIKTALLRELLNFDASEVSGLAQQITTSGLNCGVFHAIEKRDPGDIESWRFEVQFDTRTPNHVVSNVLERYIRSKQESEAKPLAAKRYEDYAQTRPDRLQF